MGNSFAVLIFLVVSAAALSGCMQGKQAGAPQAPGQNDGNVPAVPPAGQPGQPVVPPAEPEPELCSNADYNTIVDSNASGLVVLSPESQARLFLQISKYSSAALDGIADLYCLQQLNLDQADVTDITALSELSGLKSLSLSFTSVSDISQLASLGDLKVLHLGSTQVSDISPLAGLVNLEELYLRATNVSDVSALKGLKGLNVLYLNETKVSSQGCDELKKSLKETELHC